MKLLESICSFKVHISKSFSEPSAFEVELAIEKLKSHKSPGIDQIPAELIKAGGITIHYEIHKLIISIWNREDLPEEWKEAIIIPMYQKGDKTDCSTQAYQFCCVQNFIQHPAVKVNSTSRGNYWVSSEWISTQQVQY